MTRVGVALTCALWALCTATAAAEPASGPREDVDQSFTANSPATATGLGWSSTYHAAGDPKGQPPFLRRMVFYPPAGFRYDTSAPELCTASDLELSMNGPAACPAGSKIGEGVVDGRLFVPFTENVIFDDYKHHVDLLNNTNEQITLAQSGEGWVVVRGTFKPDGSLEFAGPTCYPPPPEGTQCADDYAMQLSQKTTIPLYTRAGKSYATTPHTCPASGHWATTVKLWWSDSTQDTVVTRQPCVAQRKATTHTPKKKKHRHRHRRRR